jgi:TPR repeat protein
MKRPSYVLVALLGLLLLARSTPCQNESPRELRAKARGLTLTELSEQLEQAVDFGDNQSRVVVGLGFQNLAERAGPTQERNEMFKLAASWYRMAAQKGYAPAQYFLAAELYQYEVVYPAFAECDEAFNWLDKAVSQDYVPAMTLKGWLHAMGPCNMADYPLGIEWLKKAAERGDARADFWLGEFYSHHREGVVVNEAEAAKYYFKGAQLGDAESQKTIGYWLLEASGPGPEYDVPAGFKELVGVAPSVAGALEWLQNAAEQGDRDAACGLAGIYMEGRGVPKDYITSLKWGLIADRQVHEIGCLSEDFVDLINMTPAQNIEAVQRANAWLKAHNFPTVPPQYLKSFIERLKDE